MPWICVSGSKARLRGVDQGDSSGRGGEGIVCYSDFKIGRETISNNYF